MQHGSSCTGASAAAAGPLNRRRGRAKGGWACLGLAELGLGEELVDCDFGELGEVGDDLLALLLGASLDDVLAAGVVALELGAQLEGVSELDLVGVALLLFLCVRPFAVGMLGVCDSFHALPFCLFGTCTMGWPIAICILHVCCLFKLKKWDRVHNFVCVWIRQRNNLFGVDKAP
jgi:hypothetical protein